MIKVDVLSCKSVSPNGNFKIFSMFLFSHLKNILIGVQCNGLHQDMLTNVYYCFSPIYSSPVHPIPPYLNSLVPFLSPNSSYQAFMEHCVWCMCVCRHMHLRVYVCHCALLSPAILFLFFHPSLSLSSVRNSFFFLILALLTSYVSKHIYKHIFNYILKFRFHV